MAFPIFRLAMLAYLSGGLDQQSHHLNFMIARAPMRVVALEQLPNCPLANESVISPEPAQPKHPS
jgi:hypothetical protein